MLEKNIINYVRLQVGWTLLEMLHISLLNIHFYYEQPILNRRIIVSLLSFFYGNRRFSSPVT